MLLAVIKSSVVLLLFGVCLTDIGITPVTDLCLRCICQAYSGCNLNRRCDHNACGPFRITWSYWSDADKPILPGDSLCSHDGYASCTNDFQCAALTVHTYMTRHGWDCNGDGLLNCYDYLALHKHGRSGCANYLPYEHGEQFDRCIAGDE